MSGVASSPARLRSLSDVFEQGLALAPDGAAVREGERAVSYRELDALVAELVAVLGRLGVGRGQRVAIWLPKSIEAIAAMQAVLRVGAAYVPIDPLSPVERVRRVLGDCRPAACVGLAAAAEALGEEPSDLALLTLSRPGGRWTSRRATGEEGGAGSPSRAGTATPPSPSRDQLAYVLYTSGSTGTPKGVCISHGNALAFVEWAHAELSAQSQDRFAGHAPLHFDLSVLDVYVAFLAGACVCLVPEPIAFVPTKLVEFVHEQRITVWYSVPSALMLMERAGLLQRRPAALRAVLFAGEPFPIAPLRRLRLGLPEVRLLNLYGPTETNVCSFYEVAEIGASADRPVPIGRACAGDSLWIEGEDGRSLPVGARGELVVAGPTVMLGYWGQPPQRGPYRTGDVVERISADEYRYVGREDAMVKVRGHRIELGEVEAAIASREDVLEAAVVVLGEGLESRLVAVVVSPPGPGPDLLEIKRWCAARLPRYMIVGGLRSVAELPRSRNGKVDRRALVARLEEEAA
ncbi:MAG TPA: amino acid adenylation domain-containing protein [Solirubrobacterales bacterium]|nr:amino acid adenylation domain-containing protein [Solirubrobacterales bacterium]